MKQILEKFIKILIYISFFIPILVFPNSFVFPFIVPKILALRILVTLMLGAYALLLVINWREYRPRLTALNIAVLAYMVSFAVSTFVGIDIYHSFWDNHERMLGLFTVVHYIAYYYLCSAIFKDWKDWRWALRIFLIAGSIVMLVGIAQIFNPDLLLNEGNDRVRSTLGNSIYVGAYGLFLAFTSFLLVIKEKEWNLWRWLSLGMGILGLLGPFISGTRGSMLGLVAGVGLGMVGYLIVLKENVKTRQIIGLLIILGILSSAVLFIFRQNQYVEKIPGVSRALNTSLTDLKNSPRWIAWEIAIKGWKQKPVFGWGPNNFFYVFNLNYNPKSLEHGYGETWFDNAHNIFLNTLTVQGMVGLVTYLSLFIVAAVVIWNRYRHKLMDKHVVVVGTAFLAAHLIQNITVFENPTSYLYLMFWLAMLNRLSYREKKKEEGKVIKNKQVGMGLLGTTSVICLLIIFIFNIQPARANMYSLEAIRAVANNPITAVSVINEAVSFNSPHIDDIRSDITRQIIRIVGDYYENIGKERSLELLNIGVEGLKANIKLHPLDVRNDMTLAQLNRVKTEVTADGSYLQEAKKYLESALKKSPKRQQITYALSLMHLQLKEDDQAVAMLLQTLNDNPRIAETYWRLAYTYSVMSMESKADEILGVMLTQAIFTKEDKRQLKLFFPESTIDFDSLPTRD